MKTIKAHLLHEFDKFCKRHDCILNPDTKLVRWIIKSLLENERKYGYLYCPCRIRTGNPAEDAKMICPCTYARDDLLKTGRCLCGLFVADEHKIKRLIKR